MKALDGVLLCTAYEPIPGNKHVILSISNSMRTTKGMTQDNSKLLQHLFQSFYPERPKHEKVDALEWIEGVKYSLRQRMPISLCKIKEEYGGRNGKTDLKTYIIHEKVTI